MGNLLARMYDAFASLGSEKSARILMLGLDAAGKTTILYKIKLDENIQTVPTIGMYLQINKEKHIFLFIFFSYSRF